MAEANKILEKQMQNQEEMMDVMEKAKELEQQQKMHNEMMKAHFEDSDEDELDEALAEYENELKQEQAMGYNQLPDGQPGQKIKKKDSDDDELDRIYKEMNAL